MLDPLSLDDPYLGGVEDGAEPLGGYHSLFGEIEPLLDMTSIESVAWSSGSIVSTARDLHVLITALYNGGLLSEASQQEMYGNPERQFGLFVPEWFSDTPLIGHDGRMPGSGTMFVFSPETGISAFVAVNGDHLKVSPTLGPIAELIGVSTISVAP